jgi:predicted nucleotidyltransferase
MPRTRHKIDQQSPEKWYRGTDVPLSVIRRFAGAVAERFQPDKIILFGSHAYGQPHADSDVDILVVMPARNQMDQAARIHLAIMPPFPLDILVRTPQRLTAGLRDGDSFLHEIVTKGKVLYEKDDQAVGEKGRGRLSSGRQPRRRERAPA